MKKGSQKERFGKKEKLQKNLIDEKADDRLETKIHFDAGILLELKNSEKKFLPIYHEETEKCYILSTQKNLATIIIQTKEGKEDKNEKDGKKDKETYSPEVKIPYSSIEIVYKCTEAQKILIGMKSSIETTLITKRWKKKHAKFFYGKKVEYLPKEQEKEEEGKEHEKKEKKKNEKQKNEYREKQKLLSNYLTKEGYLGNPGYKVDNKIILPF